MPKPKTDWNKLKQEYLAGEIESIDEFLRAATGLKQGVRSGYYNRMTKGWRDERSKLKQAALEAAKAKHIEQSTLPNEKLLQAKDDLLFIVSDRILEIKRARQDSSNDNIFASELKTYWEMIKVEVGEPTTVTKTENTNKNYNQEVEIDIE